MHSISSSMEYMKGKKLQGLVDNWLVYEYTVPKDVIIDEDETLYWLTDYWPRSVQFPFIETYDSWFQLVKDKCLFYFNIHGFAVPGCDGASFDAQDIVKYYEEFETRIEEEVNDQANKMCLACNLYASKDTGFCSNHQDLIDRKEEYLAKFKEQKRRECIEELEEFKSFLKQPYPLTYKVDVFTKGEPEQFEADITFVKVVTAAKFPGPKDE